MSKEIPVDQEGCSVNDRDINWLKREIKFAEKLYEKIQKSLRGDVDDFLRALPDPWTFLDDAPVWKTDWRRYVNSSLDNLNEEYPGQKDIYMTYIEAMELHKHNPSDFAEPPKPQLDPEYKQKLKVVRAFFDCQEMKYMNMLVVLADIMEREFPELLDPDYI